jgi:hypothetical protein
MISDHLLKFAEKRTCAATLADVGACGLRRLHIVSDLALLGGHLPVF